MKIMLTTAFYLLSLSAFAGFNEIECDGNSGTKAINLEIEQSFPTNNVFKRMLFSVSTGTSQANFQYTVTSNRYNGFRTILYQGSGVRLEVDLWPDSDPQWGRTYQATLTSPDLNNGSPANLNCQYPNAN